MFGGMTGRRLPLCMSALLCGIAVAGCGDDGGESTAKEKTKFAASSEAEDVFIERMAKLLETTVTKKDCAQLEEINARSFTRFPCPPVKALRKSMRSFEIVGSETYGTGAVVDYKSGEVTDGAAIVLFVSADRNWGISRFGVVTEPSVGTSDDDSRGGYDKTVDQYLSAARKRDCKGLMKVSLTRGEKDVCKTVLLVTEPLAKRLKANPSAKPKYEGGNGTYGFYTLETQKPKPENSTISVVKSTDGSATPYVVLDVTPSPTAADQLRVQREFKQQQKKKGNPNMEPSSKPSDPAVKP
jgi:hypothetical protein